MLLDMAVEEPPLVDTREQRGRDVLNYLGITSDGSTQARLQWRLALFRQVVFVVGLLAWGVPLLRVVHRAVRRELGGAPGALLGYAAGTLAAVLSVLAGGLALEVALLGVRRRRLRGTGAG